MTGEPDHHCPVEPFGQKPEYHFDLFGLGFEIVERCPLAHREGLVAGLTTQFADALGLINPTIADQGVNAPVPVALHDAVPVDALQELVVLLLDACDAVEVNVDVAEQVAGEALRLADELADELWRGFQDKQSPACTMA